MKKIILITFIFAGLFFQLKAQTPGLREVFLAAESYFLFEEFDEALPLYLRIHRQSPDNDNINFKIGVCYLNIPYEKEKSIFYLERAVQNISPRYRENNFRETSAPPEALFYLGNAYRVNNQLDNARIYYNKFLEHLDPGVFNKDLVLDQISAIDAAEELMKHPVDLDFQILDERINTRFSDINAVISGDENHMVYVSKLQFYDAVFYTEKIDGKWAAPRNIIPELGVDGDVYPASLSWDGKELYVYRSDDFIGNIYVTRLDRGKWGPLVKLNDNINTRYWESHASINKEGTKLYFTSNRKGGYGGLDIYVSERKPGGDWGPAINLGPIVNTPYNEETPFISEDGNKLYFSSYGHFNMGGYDVFVSIMGQDGKWAEPRNLGYPVNTTDDDLFFHPFGNGHYALFSRFKEDGFGRHDIYNYRIYSNEFPRMYQITGYLDYAGESPVNTDIIISVIDLASKDTLTSLNPDAEGSFQFEVPRGTYDMLFRSNAFDELIRRLEVNQYTPHEGLIIPGMIALVPTRKMLSPEELDALLTLRDTLVEVDSDEPVRIRFNPERRSKVILDVYNDSVLIATDTIDQARRREAFEFKPQPGTNIAEITVIDPNGNIITKDARVIFEKPMSTDQLTGEITEPDVSEAVVSKKDPLTEVYKSILDRHADEALKKFLSDLDISKEGLSEEDIIPYLRQQADRSDYSQDDINRMLQRSARNQELNRFIYNLARVSENNLKTTLLKLNPEEIGISNPYQLTDYLLDNEGAYDYEAKDLIKSLGILASGETDDTPAFIEELLRKTSGNLRNYIRSIPSPLIQSMLPGEMAVEIFSQAENRNFDSREYAAILTEMAVLSELDRLRNAMAELAKDDLRKVLEELNLEENGIRSSEDLIKYLYDNAGILPYSSEELDRIISQLKLQEINETEKLLNQLKIVSSGPMLKFLRDIDPAEASLSSPEELLRFLYANAEKEGFTHSDINEALLKLAYDRNLNDIINKLIRLSDGNLKKTLISLDTEKEKITNLGELIDYLLNNTDRYGYTADDVYELLKKYFALNDAELFLNKLISLSEGDIHDYLKKIDLHELNISNRQELIDHLISDGLKNLIDLEEIIRLVLKAEEIPAHQLIPDLKAIASPDLSRLIDAAAANSELLTADAVYDYLLKLAETDVEIDNKDILDLFIDYLQNYEIRRVISRLLDKAEGGILNALLEADVINDNINNIGDLINYLLSSSTEYGYFPADVFRLFDTVLGEENLHDFIQRLIPFASKHLKEFLQNLDISATGISGLDELIEYLLAMAAQNNYDPEDVWNAIMKVVLTDDDIHPKLPISDEPETKIDFIRTLVHTGLVILGLGLIIFFFIWRERKKRKDGKPGN